MRYNRIITVVSIAVVVLLNVEDASAVQLRGSNYLGATMNIYNWSDPAVSEIFGRSYGASLFGNYDLAEHWDINAVYSGAWDSEGPLDLDAHAGSVGLDYLFMPDSSVTPYIGGAAGVTYTRIGAGGVTDSSTDPAFGAQLGAEWEISKALVIDASMIYAYVDTGESNNSGDYSINVSGGIELIEHLIVAAGGSYFIEEEAALISLGVILQY